MHNPEQAFSDFLDKNNTDEIFDNFQDLIRIAFFEGYKMGEKNSGVQVIYIINKKRAEE